MTLRVIRDETPPLSAEELQKRGNDLATEIRQAAIDAVRESMHTEFVSRVKTLTVPVLRQWRHRARTARAAWEKVEALTDELIREVEKHNARPARTSTEGENT